MATARLKVGIIGAGLQGGRRARAVVSGGDTISAIADLDESRGKSFAKSYDCSYVREWNLVTEDPNIDAVIVCTPNHLHAPAVISALKSGKHVLCEKPLARTPDEAESITKIGEESVGILSTGFNLRYHAGIQLVKRSIDEGRIGKLMFMNCQYGMTGRPEYEKDWRLNLESSGGGQLMDQGIHILDLFRVFGGEFKYAIGHTASLYWKSPVEDNAYALLRTENGLTAGLHTSWTLWRNKFYFEIFGVDGYAKIDGLGGSYGVERVIFGHKDFSSPFEEEITEFRGQDESFFKEWISFASAARAHQKDFPGDGYDGLAAIKLAHAIYQSSNTRKEICLEL